MKPTKITVIPLRPAVCADAWTNLDVLVKIVPPDPELQVERPHLNLGLVVDRSGSMGAQNKIGYARQAAVFAVQQLLATDRVSLTIFDDKVETLVPNTLAEDRSRLLEKIAGIYPGGSTALHGGWREGAKQVGQHKVAGGLNRVLLLSDGLANVGETNPDAIATDVHRLATEGVSTTTLGLGDDYNEDVLEAMARSGDGNYYYIESPSQLPALFQTELQGLMAMAGTAVTLRIEPQAGVSVLDVLNELERTPEGKLELPNLVAGMPVLVLVRLKVPPLAGERELCRLHLEWNTPRTEDRQELTAALKLPAVSLASWDSLAASVDVQERAALLLIARLKKQATRLLEQGDGEEAKRQLAEARQLLENAPQTPEIKQEAEEFARIEEYLASGAWMKFQKHAKFQAYRRHFSKP